MIFSMSPLVWGALSRAKLEEWKCSPLLHGVVPGWEKFWDELKQEKEKNKQKKHLSMIMIIPNSSRDVCFPSAKKWQMSAISAGKLLRGDVFRCFNLENKEILELFTSWLNCQDSDCDYNRLVYITRVYNAFLFAHAEWLLCQGRWASKKKRWLSPMRPVAILV